MMGIMVHFQFIGINVEIERLQKDILPLRQKIDAIGKHPNQQAKAVAARRLLGVVERDLEECGKSISVLIDADESDMIAQKDNILQIGGKVIKVEEALMELVNFCAVIEGTTKREAQPEAKIKTIKENELTESLEPKMTKNDTAVGVVNVPSSTVQTAKNIEDTFTNLSNESMVSESTKFPKPKVINDNISSNIPPVTTQNIENIIKPNGETKIVSNPTEDVDDKQNKDEQSQTADTHWELKAIQWELKAIEKLPRGVDTKRPSNPYWQSLMKIATMAKKGHIEKDEALVAIKKASNHLGLSELYIENQWQRVCHRANLS